MQTWPEPSPPWGFVKGPKCPCLIVRQLSSSRFLLSSSRLPTFDGKLPENVEEEAVFSSLDCSTAQIFTSFDFPSSNTFLFEAPAFSILLPGRNVAAFWRRLVRLSPESPAQSEKKLLLPADWEFGPEMLELWFCGSDIAVSCVRVLPQRSAGGQVGGLLPDIWIVSISNRSQNWIWFACNDLLWKFG